MILPLTYFAYPGSGTETRQADYSTVHFSYGSSAGSDNPNSLDSYYRPSFYVPEGLLNKLVSISSDLSLFNFFCPHKYDRTLFLLPLY